jgi:hypothetical protein
MLERRADMIVEHAPVICGARVHASLIFDRLCARNSFRRA